MRTYLLAGELAEHRGDVAGVLGHHPADGLLHGGGNAARHAGHDLLQLQQRQRWVPEGPHELLHPVLQLRRDQSVGLRPAGGEGAATQHGVGGAPHTKPSRPHAL